MMVPAGYTEDSLVEQPALQLLQELGWEHASGFGEKGSELGRANQTEAVLSERVTEAVRRLNPSLADDGAAKAVEQITADRSAMDPARANHEIYVLLRDGAKVETTNQHGRTGTVTVRFVDWNDHEKNDWLAVSQFWLVDDMYRRRADVVLFVNGIPLVLLELKNPTRTLQEAYDDNLRDYRSTIPRLFWFNAFVVLSNGADSVMGSTYAPWNHFAEWKKIDYETEAGVVSLETMLRATCRPDRLLDIVENFVAYTEESDGLIKKVAKNHQYLGVNNAIDALAHAKANDGKLGVFWHTQGSGKSLSMLWFTQKVLRRQPGNWTFVLVTDRKELDEQLYEEFADSGVITPGVHVHAETSAHLHGLLGQDHRYVFTLIHKFRPTELNADMPVLSDRDDIIVITDEAHRSQYDTLAGNMRQALPNASFLGFTGTPLIDGEEEETRRVFGDYVSTYNFADSIRDGATVPLYYENRIPELQLENDEFDDELEELLDEAALDEAQEKAVSRRFSQQYQLITRPRRLEELAADLVQHFANRGFRGKGMYVAIDKATAIRMHDLVAERWQSEMSAIEARIADMPRLERTALEYQLEWMRKTEFAVVVSQAQNEAADLAELGLDIEPHRRKMVDQDLESRFKDSDDPFRLVFVCAMWLTGFDSPSTSTIYLDKPMRGHTLMQTIARANRVFPEKDNGLIVDYIGVFRNLEKALAIYGADRTGAAIGTPIEPTDELRSQLATAINEAENYLDGQDIELADLEGAEGLEFVALLASTTDALLIDEATRKGYVAIANRVRKSYKALMPDPEAIRQTKRVSILRTIANRIANANEVPDISEVMDGVAELLDRSVSTREYIIRAAGEEEALLDLNQIDFEQLALQFAANKRTAAKVAQEAVEQRVEQAVRKNPTVAELADRLRQLIADYNAGTHNADEHLRRLAGLYGELDEHDQRLVQEDLTEAELAIFDLLTKPEPELSDSELRKVRNAAKELLGHVEEKIVLDWRKRQQTRSAVRAVVGRVLDQELPDAYGPALFDEKCERIYEHIYSSFFDDGASVYEGAAEPEPAASPVATVPDDLSQLDEAQVEQLLANPDTKLRLLAAAYGVNETWEMTTEQLIENDEIRSVEFKQTARWNVNEQKKDRLMEEVVAKTIAGFLNGAGGTLLIGVTDDREPVGLDQDLVHVTPSDLDGYVNWLDTMLENALGHRGAHRLRISIDLIDAQPVCRVDAPAASRPIWATFKGKRQLYERRNNSTRAVPEEDVDEFITERFPDRPMDG